MKTYKTWEVMKMATENPDLEFEYKDKRGGKVIQIFTKDYLNREYILVKPEPKPISFMEAIKAFEIGKTIRCDGRGFYKKTDKLKGLDLIDNDGRAICSDEILNGKWYIVEGEENEF